ncbi:MAG TPA: apolipoprotein N-acyltransferase [Deltaproteobacteria bacterium]|nr:apolipoprotein N-acyltransferase [Deltaproteobacteria bacterium]
MRTGWQRRWETGAIIAAATISGLLYAWGFVVDGLWPVLVFFLLPFWWALERAVSRSPAFSGGVGFVFGAAAYIAGHLWLFRLVDVFLGGRLGIGVAFWSLYGSWFAFGFVVYGLIHRGLRRRGVGRVVSSVAPWVVLEWAWPLLFPVHCGAPLVDAGALGQVADLGGPLLLGSLILLANAGFFESAMWLAGRGGRPVRVWLSVAIAIGFSLGYAEARAVRLSREIESTRGMQVGIVQANLGLLEKRTLARVGHRRHLEETRRLLSAGPIDLVVWPETAHVRAIRGPLPVSGRLVQQGIGVPLLFGGSLLDSAGPEPVQSNSALLVGRDGMIRDAYRKNLLIPLAEWIPFLDRWPVLQSALPHAQRFSAASEVPPLRFDDWRISVPICYEAVRPDFVRHMVNEARPNLLVSLANDAWFGDSSEPWLHLRSARLRSIEHRLFMVRATNSGISAIVDPSGRILARTGVAERAVLRGVVHPMAGGTLYARLGDWPGTIALLVIGAALGSARLSPSSRGHRGSDPLRRSTCRHRG